jgi:hypothetical protein
MLAPGIAFDALLFIDTLTPAHTEAVIVAFGCRAHNRT